MFKFFKRKKKYNICITTYYDQSFSNIGELCKETIRKYASLYGCDTFFYDSISSKRPYPWHKILVIQKLFSNGYDFVLWVDADAIFVRYDKNIAGEIVPDKDLYLVKHCIEGKDTPNTGIFLIRNSTWSQELLRKIWNKREYVHHCWWENAALIDLFGYQELLDENETNCFNYTLLKKVQWVDIKWNSLPGICESENSIVHHYAGRDNVYRYHQMRQDLIKFSRIVSVHREDKITEIPGL